MYNEAFAIFLKNELCVANERLARYNRLKDPVGIILHLPFDDRCVECKERHGLNYCVLLDLKELCLDNIKKYNHNQGILS